MIDWMKNFIDNYTGDMYFPAIEVKDVIEILIITVILYEIMLWIKNTKAWMLLRGIIMLGAFILLAWIFQMHTILYLAAQSINVLAIAAIVVFQPELRRALEKLGEKAHMYREWEGVFSPDTFAHEQSLVFDTSQGLVIFNSCSHGGADNIIREVGETFPDKKIYALFGGLHLHASADEDVLALAKRIRQIGIRKIYTGHCTGEEGYRILHDVLGDRTHQLEAGLEIVL